MTNELLKSDGLLAVALLLVGMVGTVELFYEKLILIVLVMLVVGIRSFLKSRENWRKANTKKNVS